jgi:hypothetical protein
MATGQRSVHLVDHTFGQVKSFFWRMLSHPLSVRVKTVVVGLEKEGDLDGKGFN